MGRESEWTFYRRRYTDGRQTPAKMLSITDHQSQRNQSESLSVMFKSLGPHGLKSPWNSLGQNTGVGSLSLLQGIFPTQGSNQGLPHCRWILYQLSHKGSPRILERGSLSLLQRIFPTQESTGVSCITGGFFTS